MLTVAEMISRRLREMDAQFTAEATSPQARASGGAVGDHQLRMRLAAGIDRTSV